MYAATESRPAPPPAPARAAATRDVFLVAPFAPRGGGMGRIMTYLAGETLPGYRFTCVESRGGGHPAWSMAPLSRAAARILAAPRGTIVHVNMAEGSSVWRKGALLAAARAAGHAGLLHLHAADIVGFHARLPRPGQAAMGHIFRSAAAVAVLGGLWRDWAISVLGVPAERVVIVRNGVPRPDCARVRAGRAFHLVFVGNLLARKGLDDLCAALGRPELAGIGWRLTVAGGGDTARVARLAVRAGITERVTVTGWLDRAATSALLATADALVLPSHAEGLPLVLLEASALGIPVVTTTVGAIPETYRDGETALLVSPGARDELAASILRLAANPALAARLGRAGAALYEAEYTLAHFGRRLHALYEERCPA